MRAQATLERSIGQFIDNHRGLGFANASAMLLDRDSGEVRALVGSANYFDASIDGQVNGTEAKRSPGSILKPFIYGLALDQGLLHPATMLKDAPTAFGPFSPENFDGRFVGPISAQEALVGSRNVPAVAVASKLANPRLYDFLKNAGVTRLATEQHDGLALALGGAEVTMEELGSMYLMLANRGVLTPISHGRRAASDNPKAQAPRLLSEEAAFITLQTLRTNRRPDTGEPAAPPVAWKTGTSWGFATRGRRRVRALRAAGLGRQFRRHRQPGLRRRADGGAAVLPHRRQPARPAPRSARGRTAAAGRRDAH
ncbi:MAG: Penicillin-binding protein [Massilia sp.]|nr:Penicillin-binding protein [Massilia sp.]